MDIRIDRNTPIQNAGLDSTLPLNGAIKNVNTAKPALTVTRADATEDVDTVSDDVLRRDDALGKLVSSVYNLPAPPMPDFK